MLENRKLIELYEIMQTIRKVEHRIEAEYRYDEMKTPIHLSIGQEAVAAGVCINLRKDDIIFGTHRFHGQYIAKGGDLKSMIAEMYLRKTGCSSGRGGSMHLIDPECGVMGSSAIVGGVIPLGTGTAMASQLQKNDRVTVVFFSDGAVDEGVFHESLNFASLKKLPVIYVCENNDYAIHSPRSQRHSGEIFRLAQGYNMPGYQIDGNDVLKVSDYATEAVERCRKGLGPTLLECMTYRWKGHVGTVDDLGEGFRPVDQHRYWLSRCPIKWYADYLRETGIMEDDLEAAINQKIDQLIEDAFEFAKQSEKPDPAELMEYVYA